MTLGLDTIEILHSYVEPTTGQKAPLVSDEFYQVVMANKDKLDAAVDYERDYT